MSKRIFLSLLTTLFALSCALQAFGQSGSSRALLRGAYLRAHSSRFANASSEREQDGLNGPVRRVRTETVKLSNKNGKMVESQRVTLEVAAYDIKGAKIENAYYPVPGAAATGKEVYKYDDKGNIIEMTLQDEKGTLLSKETYTYEFDQFGNWTKMTTSVAVIENGKITFEPTEVTYRSISYYLDEATMAKMNEAAAPANTGNAANAVALNATTPNNNAASNAAPSSSPSSKPAVPTSSPANDSSSAARQPSQNVAANKPAANSDASRQAGMQSGNAPASSTPIVRTSAPVSDRPAASEQAKSLSSNDKPVESKPVEGLANKPVIKPLLKPVSGGVLNGKAVNLPKPVYPLTAKSARMTGVVAVEVVIDVNGRVISARAVNGPALLQQAAVQAAYQAKFSPTILSGQPVKVVGTINYNFSLAQ
jgi:TonB family protein